MLVFVEVGTFLKWVWWGIQEDCSELVACILPCVTRALRGSAEFSFFVFVVSSQLSGPGGYHYVLGHPSSHLQLVPRSYGYEFKIIAIPNTYSLSLTQVCLEVIFCHAYQCRQMVPFFSSHEATLEFSIARLLLSVVVLGDMQTGATQVFALVGRGGLETRIFSKESEIWSGWGTHT